jgi:uncharacterized sulfatase
MRAVIVKFGTLCCLAILVPASAAAQTRPNLLVLTTEDIGPHLGCYGDTVARTPNLDAFAAQSLTYDFAWSTYPVCAPARSALITGCYPASTGGGNMRSMMPLPAAMRMFPCLLREAGYYCTNNHKQDYNHPLTGQVWDESSPRAHYRHRAAGQPFLAVFNHTGTHESQIRTQPHTLVTDPAQIELPAYFPDLPAVRRDWAQYYDNVARMDEWFARQLRELSQAGLADDTIVLFFGDHGSGMPRHKRYPGDSGLRVPWIVHVPAKFRHLAPMDYVAGGRTARLIGFVDFAPTLLSLAGLEPPSWMQGRAAMGPFVAEPSEYLFGYRERMDERPDLVRSVRDNRYVYLRNYLPHRPHGQHVAYQFETSTTRLWHERFVAGELTPVQARFWRLREAEELYDLQADPGETRNLAGDPAAAAVLARFREAHRDQVFAIRDLGLLPESLLEEIAATDIPREYAVDPGRYRLAEIWEAAEVATRREVDWEPLAGAARSADPAVRYWAAVGLLVRGERAVEARRDALRELVEDGVASVRIPAAEALLRYGQPEDARRGYEALLAVARAGEANHLAAVEALNALDAAPTDRQRLRRDLATIPVDVGQPPRMGAYLRQLREFLGEDASR